MLPVAASPPGYRQEAPAGAEQLSQPAAQQDNAASNLYQPAPVPEQPPGIGMGLPEEDASDPSATGASASHLALADVIASVYRCYPEVLQAQQERARTAGLQTQAAGAYDLKLEGYTLSEPTGYYENYRHGIGVARQTWWGGYVSAGYRMGRGEFAPWYKERETNKAGEFKLGLVQPLLQGRALDAQRVALFQSQLAQQAANPYIQQAILDAARDASVAYWEWVSGGTKLRAQNKLLRLAEQRGEQFQQGFNAGQFAEVDLVLNQQLIAERKVKVLEAEQKYRASSFKLSLYLRDANGEPMVPNRDWLPRSFPSLAHEDHISAEQELGAALQRRPELQLLLLQLQQMQWDQRQAMNQMLPSVDLVAEASQDIGTPTSSYNDKGQFELVFGVQGQVPIQRRKARGKLQSTSAKMSQLNEKLRLQQNKVLTELQIQGNTLELDGQIVAQSRTGLTAALDTLQRYRFAFQRGKADLIYLNLLETKATETELKWLDAQRDWFATLAELQRALALDPLEQANEVSQLPPTEAPLPPPLPDQPAPGAVPGQ